MFRVGARREHERAVPRATGVPRLAKPARQAGYARGAPRSFGVCRRIGSRPSRRHKREEPAQVAGGGHEVPLAPALRPTAALAAAKPHRLLDLRERPRALGPARALPLAPDGDQTALRLRLQRRPSLRVAHAGEATEHTDVGRPIRTEAHGTEVVV